MPLPLVRHSGQPRLISQTSVSQLIRPPEPRVAKVKTSSITILERTVTQEITMQGFDSEG